MSGVNRSGGELTATLVVLIVVNTSTPLNFTLQPSFRAYGEHIEVVSRRYLQNYKWRDSTKKNQVRIRLKDHALSVIARCVHSAYKYFTP